MKKRLYTLTSIQRLLVTHMHWLMVFLKLLSLDVTAASARLECRVRLVRVRYKKFKIRKLEERSLFFEIAFFPSMFYSYYRDEIKARAAGKTLIQFREEETRKIELENEARRSMVNQARVEAMAKFAESVPGATVNDWNNFVENPRIYSFWFLMSSIKELIFG